jgi:hypothetical protein
MYKQLGGGDLPSHNVRTYHETQKIFHYAVSVTDI